MTAQLIAGRPAKKNVRVLAILMAFFIAIGSSISFAPPASADTGGYPYASYNGPGTDPSQSWWTDLSGNGYSGYGYAYRNCTDYVAWKLQSLGVADAKTRGLGNGREWASNAEGKSGVTVSSTPAYGAAAVQTSGTYGHVAFVQSVNTDGTITVSEYNHGWPLDGSYGTRTGTASALGFVSFVHFGLSTPAPAGSGSFSGDANDDILWYESSLNGQGKLIKANSNGTDDASADVWFTGFAAPAWAGKGDFNKDGYTDLAWYETAGGTLKVMFSNGTSFATSKTWFTGYAAPTKAFVGDFTGDGYDDIAWYESWNNTLKVIKTASDGSVAGTSNGGSYNWLVGWGNPTWAGVGNFDGDAYDDIAWYESWNNGSLKVIYSNGNGTREIKNWFSGYGAPTWAGVGNFTGGNDKKDDIAWYESWNNGKMSVIQSNGLSAGSSITWFTGYAAPTRVFVGNFNGETGDYRDDIGWYEASNNGKLSVLLTNSTGTGGSGTYPWFTGFSAPTWADAG